MESRRLKTNWPRRCFLVYYCIVLYIDRDNLRLEWDGTDCVQIALVEQRDWSVPAEHTQTKHLEMPPSFVFMIWMLTASFLQSGSAIRNFPVPSCLVCEFPQFSQFAALEHLRSHYTKLSSTPATHLIELIAPSAASLPHTCVAGDRIECKMDVIS